MESKNRATRNRTITLTEQEKHLYSQGLISLHKSTTADSLLNKIINQDLFDVLDLLPESFVDLLFVDPPYNLTKSFNGKTFAKMGLSDYTEWLDSWLSKLVRILKPNASIYICGDWRSSHSIYEVVSKYFIVHNRITWEREKGRGAKSNWKNASEDIWFCTLGESYTFNVEQVKMKKKVLAPYRNEEGVPKDWEDIDSGKYRLTYPSNMWTDLTVPFWSMPENTDHPTQKPEKLLAKIILASSNEGDVVFDPFLGSGTTAVVAKKLNRHYSGIEIDELYGCLIEKRLKLADDNNMIQGYKDGVFWERNSTAEQIKKGEMPENEPEVEPITT